MIINEVNKEELLNFEYVAGIVKEQFDAVLSTDPEFYSQYNFEIVNEQYYVPDEEREPNNIFVVIKFSAAEIYYGQIVMPLTIQVVSEQNGLIAAQRLLLEYAQIFNLNILMRDNKTIYQNYTTPNVISNFEVVYEGFRSVLIMSGVFLLSNNINMITLKYYDGDYAALSFPEYVSETLPGTKNLGYIYVYYNGKIYKWSSNKYVEWDFTDRLQDAVGLNDEIVNIDMFELPDESKIYIWDENENKYIESEGEKIDIMNFTDTFDASPNTQPYFSNNNFTDSVIKYGTYSFNITSFLIDNNLNNKVLKIKSRKKNVNNNFYFKICYDNGLDMPLLKFKLLNATSQQNKAELPSFVLAFTN